MHHCLLLRILFFDNSGFLAAVLENSPADSKIDSFLSMLQFLCIDKGDENGSFKQPRHNMRFSRLVNLRSLPGLFAFFILPVSLNFIHSLCTADYDTLNSSATDLCVSPASNFFIIDNLI